MVLRVFLNNATAKEEEDLGGAISALVEHCFLGRPYKIKSTRSDKEWL